MKLKQFLRSCSQCRLKFLYYELNRIEEDEEDDDQEDEEGGGRRRGRGRRRTRSRGRRRTATTTTKTTTTTRPHLNMQRLRSNSRILATSVASHHNVVLAIWQRAARGQRKNCRVARRLTKKALGIAIESHKLTTICNVRQNALVDAALIYIRSHACRNSVWWWWW